MISKIFTLFILALITGCGIWKGYTPDNPSEEFLEAVIKSQTGIEIDLSPKSLENKYDR